MVGVFRTDRKTFVGEGAPRRVPDQHAVAVDAIACHADVIRRARPGQYDIRAAHLRSDRCGSGGLFGVRGTCRLAHGGNRSAALAGSILKDQLIGVDPCAVQMTVGIGGMRL